MISSLLENSSPTVSCRFLPRLLDPRSPMVTTSPTLYPVPPLFIVAPTATPLVTAIFAVPFLPFPLTAISGTLLKVSDPLEGVYPTPALVIAKVPTADPAVPT